MVMGLTTGRHVYTGIPPPKSAIKHDYLQRDTLYSDTLHVMYHFTKKELS